MSEAIGQNFSYADLGRYFEFEGEPLGQLERHADGGSWILPSETIIAVRDEEQGHRLESFEWGTTSLGPILSIEPPNNANAPAALPPKEPKLRKMLHNQRCIIPITNFWKEIHEPRGRAFYNFIGKTESLLLVAGLWTAYIEPISGETKKSATIILTAPTKRLRPYVNQMPTIIRKEDMAVWLAGNLKLEELRKTMKRSVLSVKEAYWSAQRENPLCFSDTEIFTDNDIALEKIMSFRFGARKICANPQCNRQARYYRIRQRLMFKCGHCGHEIYPLAETPFKESKIPLSIWYSTIERLRKNPGTPTAKIQRETGLSYNATRRTKKIILGQLESESLLSIHYMPTEHAWNKSKNGGSWKPNPHNLHAVQHALAP